ncbi:glycosyltransferase family 2 protein [Shewanella algae]|uniref:glycosyltransferase family 2 protein n=1 Tax=Shewanella algae TaxID=38313 RepID=UPI0031F4B47C
MSHFQPKAPATFQEILCNRNQSIRRQAEAEYRAAPVLIAIAHKNQPLELVRALKSAVTQTLIQQKKAQILVLDDSSEPNWQTHAEAYLLHPSVTLISAECGSPARARNLMLDWADDNPAVQWVARLDADDELAYPNSLERLWLSVHREHCVAAIGSNYLRIGDTILDRANIADPSELLSPQALAGFIESFAEGQQQRELPSCNLLLKTGLGLRYPNIRSAEDHWLLTRLLMRFGNQVAVNPSPVYAIYSLSGNDTAANKQQSIWQEQRTRLASAASSWAALITHQRDLLGVGMEGAVWRQHNQVVKEFYPWAIDDTEVSRLQQLLDQKNVPIPKVRWRKCDGRWQYQTPYAPGHQPGERLTESQVRGFLLAMYQNGISALNIKRENLLLTESGELLYIDIGKDIQPLTSSNFQDMCARLYSIGILGNKDEEWVRRLSWRRQDEALEALPGFAAFYSELMATLHPHCQPGPPSHHAGAANALLQPEGQAIATNVSLLIKACGQDAQSLTAQVQHIVTHLQYPVRFAKKLLLIDTHEGDFLRQYASANLTAVMAQAETLKQAGLIDEILLSPKCQRTIRASYQRWFEPEDKLQQGSAEVLHTHTKDNAPLFPQVWAFEKIDTRYVLQCDLDVIIGKRDWQHDYLADMLYAAEPVSVLAVGFNIAKSTSQFLPYHGEPGQFAPEVRLGLLDLERIKALLPIANPVSNGRYTLTWHRALQAHMKTNHLRALRGGDPATFYVHPRNEHKHLPSIAVAADIIAQGREPMVQQEAFDWQPQADWLYPKRSEPLVFLLKGRFTDVNLLARCLDSLCAQHNQNFGVIVIDDASTWAHNWCYPLLLKELWPRTTLVRHLNHQGRMPNFLQAINDLCEHDNSLIAVLDQDDCLMHPRVVDLLLKARSEGADLIQMPMYRPNKPLRLYRPDYRAPRQAAGANVWSHLRVFNRGLFRQVPLAHFKRSDGQWFDTVTDYLTMLPMAELALNPQYLDDGYACWHLRRDYGSEEKAREQQLIEEILAKPPLSPVPQDPGSEATASATATPVCNVPD